MSSISKAGIFIDVKQLLEFTHRMNKEMTVADRNDYGRQLIRYNLDMITNFTMAYHRRDERVSFDADRKHYDINLRGEKRTYVDALEASFDSYQALMEFCFENLQFPRMKARKRRRRHKHFMELMANLTTGIVKWRAAKSADVATTWTPSIHISASSRGQATSSWPRPSWMPFNGMDSSKTTRIIR